MRSWTDDLYDALVDQFGEERGVDLHERYAEAFPPAYQQDSPLPRPSSTSGAWRRSAAATTSGCTCTGRWRPRRTRCGSSSSGTASRSPSPTSCRSWRTWACTSSTSGRTRCARPAPTPVWIYDFGLAPRAGPTSTTTGCASASRRPSRWSGAATWRTTGSTGSCSARAAGAGGAVVRAYAKYLRQVGATFSLAYTVATLAQQSRTGPRGSSSSSRCDWIPTRPTTGSWSPSTRSSRARGRARRGHQPRRGPDPARSAPRRRGDAAHELLPGGAGRRAQAVAARQARPGADPRPAAPAADVRDLRLLAPCRGRPPARRARSRAAACAGPTAARTSAPRSSD